MQKNVLVTGADGFIGSHLTEYLVRGGYKVRALALYNSFNSWGWLDSLPKEILAEVEVVTGDIRDPNGVRSALAGQDAVLHLAALIAIPYSYHLPDTYVETNIKGTLNVLQAARDLGVGKIVHTSTSEVYGTAQFVPISESHPLHPQSPYAATKSAADQLALSFFYSFSTPVAVIRPFNTYGPRQSCRAVIPTIITQLASGKRRIKLGDLGPTRDFNFVVDTVAAFVAVLESNASIGQVLNAGSGYEVSIGALAGIIAELMDLELEIDCDPSRLRPAASEVERLCADNSRLRALTAWQPAYGGPEGLRKGLAKTIVWFSRPGNLKYYKTDIYNI